MRGGAGTRDRRGQSGLDRASNREHQRNGCRTCRYVCCTRGSAILSALGPDFRNLLLLMRRPATGSIGPSWVDGGGALLDIHDLSFFIHHKGGAVRHAVLRHQNAISCGDFAVIEIAQKRERSIELGGEFFLGRGVVGTNAKNFGVVTVKFCNTSLVCSDFAGSTTGEGCGEECQHHGILAAETG
jgi:hypothetical protein